MNKNKQPLASIFFRSLAAIAIGMIIMAGFTAMLNLYGTSQETPAQTAQQPFQFPENEQMLDDLAARLVQEGERLADIAPAAGGDNDSPEDITAAP